MMKKTNMNIQTVAGLLLSVLLLAACSPAAESPVIFESPEAAVDEVAKLIESRDPARIELVFGPGSVDMFSSGDAEADNEDLQRVSELIAENVAFEEHDENTLVALFGTAEWPWPIPLARKGDGWVFDTANGREELINRRVGHNELWTLTALHEVVDAQWEYRAQGQDGQRAAFAARFLSSEGKRDGLYWPSEEESDISPLGELLAESEVHKNSPEEPQPFHGYHYRMLLKRGADAPGGELDYADEAGLLTLGIAVAAWPAKYGNSGVMTFITDQRGLVYEKDLGEETAALAAAIDSFNPDPSWLPTPDRLTETEEAAEVMAEEEAGE
jgi:hypothetical protein